MNKKIFKVGITGGIGSGKSLICKIFSVFGIPIYDADSRAKWLLNHDSSLIEEVKKYFGASSYNPKGLDSAFIADVVFNDHNKLTYLNELVHPRVAIDYENWLSQHQGYPYTIKEAALLFESGSYKSLDKIINVSAAENVRIKRVLMRDIHRSEEQVKSIISRQLKDEERQEKADFNIRNDGTSLVIPQAWKIHNKIVQFNSTIKN